MQKLVSQFPPVADAMRNSEKTPNAEASEPYAAPHAETVAAQSSPIDVREWVIEPEAEELARVSLVDLPVND